jgi:hypothetical protein
LRISTRNLATGKKGCKKLYRIKTKKGFPPYIPPIDQLK